MIYTLLGAPPVAIFKLLFRVKAIGRENIPKKGGFILASNHVSFFDPLALGAGSPRRLNFMARHDLFKVPVFGWALLHIGSIPVKRDSADISALKTAIRRLKHGEVLALFPEGTRGEDGKLLDPKSGIGFITAKANVPVIPAFVQGTADAWPKGAKKVKLTKVTVTFGKPVHFEKDTPYLEISRQIMQGIRQLAP